MIFSLLGDALSEEYVWVLVRWLIASWKSGEKLFPLVAIVRGAQLYHTIAFEEPFAAY